jgi:hypothetical protein
MEAATCDCCKLPNRAVNEDQLCFECSFIQTSVSIAIEAGLAEEATFNIVNEIRGHVMPELIERLQKDPPLLEEILRTWSRTDKPN